MENQKTHWRTVMNTTYLNGDEIAKGDTSVTITGYEEEELYSQQSKQKEKHVTLTLKEFDKPMILTNRKAKQIAKALDTPLMGEWIGKVVNIHPVKEKHFGDWFFVINIKKGAILKETLTPKSAGWKKACEALESGSTTIEAIEKYYTLSAADKKTLTNLKVKK